MQWLLYAIFAAIFLSLADIFRKRGLYKEHAQEFVTVRYFFSALIALLFIPFIDISMPIDGWYLLSIATLLAVTAIIFRAKAYRHLEISTVVPFFNLSPAFIAITAYFLLGESISTKQIIGIGILVVGTYILEVDHNIHTLLCPFKKILGSRHIHYIFVVLLLFAFETIIIKKLLDKYLDPLSLLFLMYIMYSSVIFLITWSMFGTEGVKHSFRTGKRDAFFSAIFGIGNGIFTMKAYTLQMVSLVVPIKRFSTIFTTIGGGTIFKDKGLHLKAVGCMIMFIGAYLVAL